MKIEISIEKGHGEEKDMEEKGMPMSEAEDEGEMELTPEQIAEMAKKLKGNASLSRAERTMLADYLLSED